MKNHEKISTARLLSILLLGVFTTIAINCTSPDHRKNNAFKIEKIFSLPARVLTVDKNLVIIKIKKPDLFEGSVKLAYSLAKTIIANSYLIEGKTTNLNQHRAKITRVSGNNIHLKIQDPKHPFLPGQKTRVSLERKTIAIKDFEVIVGRNKKVAKYVQEDITTALVNSGQFNVVERLKLKTVIEELELSQTGAIDPDKAKKAGKLLSADVILTGTFASTGKKWNVNLRMINTETGMITAAFNKTDFLHDFKAESYRETGNIEGRFENKNSLADGWITGKKIGLITGKGGFQKIFIEKKQGANGTHRCIAMKFKLGSERVFNKGFIRARIRNRLKRDLNKYTGIIFHIKASQDITVRFHLSDSQKDNKNEETWFRNISATKNWQKIKFSFNSLSLIKRLARKYGTNEILDLSNIEKMEWKVVEVNVERGTKGTIWVDEVSFY